MGNLLRNLKTPSAFHSVEANPHGFLIVRRDPSVAEDFNRLARAAIDGSGQDYVAFPVTDGHAGYDQVVILPLDTD